MYFCNKKSYFTENYHHCQEKPVSHNQHCTIPCPQQTASWEYQYLIYFSASDISHTITRSRLSVHRRQTCKKAEIKPDTKAILWLTCQTVSSDIVRHPFLVDASLRCVKFQRWRNVEVLLADGRKVNNAGVRCSLGVLGPIQERVGTRRALVNANHQIVLSRHFCHRDELIKVGATCLGQHTRAKNRKRQPDEETADEVTKKQTTHTQPSSASGD